MPPPPTGQSESGVFLARHLPKLGSTPASPRYREVDNLEE